MERRTVNSEEIVEREVSVDEDVEQRESEDDVERNEEEVEHREYCVYSNPSLSFQNYSILSDTSTSRQPATF